MGFKWGVRLGVVAGWEILGKGGLKMKNPPQGADLIN